MCHAEASIDPSLDIHIAFASLAFDVGARSAVGNTLALVWGQFGKKMASLATTEATTDA